MLPRRPEPCCPVVVDEAARRVSVHDPMTDDRVWTAPARRHLPDGSNVGLTSSTDCRAAPACCCLPACHRIPDSLCACIMPAGELGCRTAAGRQLGGRPRSHAHLSAAASAAATGCRRDADGWQERVMLRVYVRGGRLVLYTCRHMKCCPCFLVQNADHRAREDPSRCFIHCKSIEGPAPLPVLVNSLHGLQTIAVGDASRRTVSIHIENLGILRFSALTSGEAPISMGALRAGLASPAGVSPRVRILSGRARAAWRVPAPIPRRCTRQSQELKIR